MMPFSRAILVNTGSFHYEEFSMLWFPWFIYSIMKNLLAIFILCGSFGSFYGKSSFIKIYQ